MTVSTPCRTPGCASPARPRRKMVSATEQRRFAGVVLVVLLLDLATKLAAEIWLRRYVGVPVIGEFFQLRLVYNPGAAFGINVGEYSRGAGVGGRPSPPAPPPPPAAPGASAAGS